MSYDLISNILLQQNSDMGAAEAHGIATGMLCVDNRSDAANWLAEIFSDEQLDYEEKSILLNLYEQTQKLLNPEEEEFTFDLFLPDDDEDLSERAEAIRQWCQGFLFGIGYQKTSSDWPGESGEIMRDIVEFTKLETDVSGDEDEQALMEIQEYLRAAVLLVRDQLQEHNDTEQSH